MKRCVNNGFTLVEVLIVVTILAFAFTGLMKLFVYIPYLSETTADKTIALQDIHNKITEMRNTNFDDIIPNYACACFDYIDNDSDGIADYDHDPGDTMDGQCSQVLDNSETVLNDATVSRCRFPLTQLSAKGLQNMGVIYLKKSQYIDRNENETNNFNDDDKVNNSLLEVEIVASWKDGYGRVTGEDVNFNGLLDSGEDTNGDGKLSSPATVSAMISRR